MHIFLLFLLFLVFLFYLALWFVKWIIAWFLYRTYTISVQIGDVTLPRLKLHKVTLIKANLQIDVTELSIRSSILSSDVGKLLTLVLRDVHIVKNVTNHITTNPRSPIDFRDMEIPHFVHTFAQFMAIHIYNLSTTTTTPNRSNQLDNNNNKDFIEGTAAEVHLDGSLRNTKSLLVTCHFIETSIRLMRTTAHLAQLQFDCFLEVVLTTQGPLSINNLDVKLTETSALIDDDLYKINVEKSNLSQINFDYILPLIPKNCALHVTDTYFKGGNSTKSDYNAILKNAVFNYRSITNLEQKPNEENLHILFNLNLVDFSLKSHQDQLVYLNQMGIDAKLKNSNLNIHYQINTLSLSYNHTKIFPWICHNFLPLQIASTSLENRSNRIGEFLRKFSLTICMELVQISTCFVLETLPCTMCIGHTRFLYEQNTLKLAKLWNAEVLLESISCRLDTCKFNGNSISRKLHYWGTPLNCGMVLFKIKGDEPAVKIAALVDTVQLEWTKDMLDFLHFFISFQLYVGGSTPQLPLNKWTNTIEANLTVAHLNCFFHIDSNEYFVMRLNTVKMTHRPLKTIATLDDLKVFSIVANDLEPYYFCIRSEDVDDYKLYVKRIEYVMKTDVKRPLNALTFSEEFYIVWTANFHLKTYLLLCQLNEFYQFARAQLPTTTSMSSLLSSDWHLTWTGVVEFTIVISVQHQITTTIDKFSGHVSNDDRTCQLDCRCLHLALDGVEIYQIKGICLSRLTDSDVIREERADNEQFQLLWNPNSWHLTVNVLKAIFPFEHQYACAIHDQFFSIVKWLRHLHKRQTDQQTRSLPNDLLIHVKDLLFEMSDDPFEVKLRDNFELLVDEYNESLKRQKMLNEKVAELFKTYLHLPADKVEELYANLKRKNAEIYIQRSKQMSQNGAQRTRLFAWTMTNIELMILVDPSIDGRANCVDIMRHIDVDSPWPEDGLEFSTLWCRVVSLRCQEWKIQLRDFPQPLLHITQCFICGQLVGAQQMAPRRAVRSVCVELDWPFRPHEIERTMLPLKFYHDFNCEIEGVSYAFGPCWEPVVAQCNLSFEKIVAPSRDPSPPLPFWDKMRLLVHGRLTLLVQQLTVLLHASLDPYNTTEEMELTWNHVVIDWTNARFIYKGDLNIFVRTASKYDDCQLLNLPNLKLILGLQWICLGDPNDHHNVIQCAPDKIPEYSSNQEHDSYRAFRSQNLNLNITLETHKSKSKSSPMTSTNLDYPVLMLYGSTLRWIENLKMILSGVTRPTKRGRVFRNVRGRKLQLSRHYRKIHLLIGLHRFQVCYWMSFAMQKGCELIGGRLTSSSEHVLNLVPLDDGLIHRRRAEWSIVYVNCELSDSEIWLKSAWHTSTVTNSMTDLVTGDDDVSSTSQQQTAPPPVEKCYCLYVAKVSYGREEIVIPVMTSHHHHRDKDTPTHRLVVYDLRGAWTNTNRNVAFALFDTFVKNKQMKKNLSATEVLKTFWPQSENLQTAKSPTTTTTTPLKRREHGDILSNSKIQSTTMLEQLIAEVDNKSTVYSDDLSSANSRQHYLQGAQACQQDDVQYKNWQISLVNAQVLLKGCETIGYVIISAAKADICQRVHRPVWKDDTLVSKTTWTGLLECMQYYATVNAGENDTLNENIMWLTVDNIQEKDSTELSAEPSEVPKIVGSGVSVGAVVSDTVGASNSHQLQRIVSRCKCEFFYACYGDTSVDPASVIGGGDEVTPPPQPDDVDGPWERRQSAVDAFTLMHHDLDVCTNSLQYAMLLDIVNNLLLYVEPHRREALERLARMRFQWQLHSGADQRTPIQNQQILVRSLVSKLRRLEKDTYLIGRQLADNPDQHLLVQDMAKLEQSVYECKTQLNQQSDELDMMLSCYKQTKLLANSRRLAIAHHDKPLVTVRTNEICFKHAQWRLTETDGQIGIADLVLSDFLYTKTSKSDDSVEHLLELGYLRVTNLLKNEIYEKVICPTELQHGMPIEHKKVLRIFCREKQPVGGISVKEHFEINLVPLTIGLTKKFYNTMMKFCFPERDMEITDYSTVNPPQADRGSTDLAEDNVSVKSQKVSKGRRTNRSDSNFYVHIDDVEKMKERAKNKLFVYIKVPEVPVKVSYKGNKEKNLEDLRDVSMVVPTLEYHNMTWTWLDLLIAIRNECKRVILPQAIKQKLQIKRNTAGSMDQSSSSSPQEEEDKARMLFGAKHILPSDPSKTSSSTTTQQQKKSTVFKFSK